MLLSLRARAARQVLYITLGVSAASYAFVYAALVGLAPGLALLRGQPWRKLQTIASMAATLAIARSPASMVSLHGCSSGTLFPDHAKALGQNTASGVAQVMIGRPVSAIQGRRTFRTPVGAVKQGAAPGTAPS